MCIGEADAGLEIDSTILPSTPSTSPLQLSQQQKHYATTLPPAAVLRARLSAYEKLNARLETEGKGWRDQSSELEGMLRKIVGLCTGVGEARVDEMVAGLCKAVRSEEMGDVEVGRVREFLRRVESTDG